MYSIQIYKFTFSEAMSDLCICKLSDTNASVIGGKEMILLCEKVGKGKISCRFFRNSYNSLE